MLAERVLADPGGDADQAVAGVVEGVGALQMIAIATGRAAHASAYCAQGLQGSGCRRSQIGVAIEGVGETAREFAS